MYLVACGVIGLGDLISEMDSGRPFGMSIVILLSRREARLELVDGCLSREECLDERLSLECFDELVLEEDLLDFSCGTSRMFKMRPVVGSVVDDWPGSWDTW
jgi:hypothetical protein